METVSDSEIFRRRCFIGMKYFLIVLLKKKKGSYFCGSIIRSGCSHGHEQIDELSPGSHKFESLFSLSTLVLQNKINCDWEKNAIL